MIKRSLVRHLGFLACVLSLAVGLQTASAFSLYGPYDDWQTANLGWRDANRIYGEPAFLGGVQNLGEEYRYNIPVLYYAFDSSFINYFGTNGINAVTSAFEVLNALTNTPFSQINIDQYPLDVFRVNPLAEQLNLIDMKSWTLNLLLEELGLTEPDMFVYTLRDRRLQPGSQCPDYVYNVIMRNFDPHTYDPSPYINGVLYTYNIIENCPAADWAYTQNFPVDPTAIPNYPVISASAFGPGAYAVGLSRDDVGGLKYLYRRDNVNMEPIANGSFQFVTNRTQPQLVFTSNLWTFAEQALTNDAAALTALYPGVIITGTSNYWTNIVVTNLTAYITNAPWMPLGSAFEIRFATNLTLSIQPRYIHTFGNLFTALNTDEGFKVVPISTLPTTRQRVRVAEETTIVNADPWLPIDAAFTTNVTRRIVTRNGFVGDFFILPTNACNLEIIGLQAQWVTQQTNFFVSAFNDFLSTNGLGGGIGGGTNGTGTNVQLASFSRSVVRFETNRAFLAYPVICETTNGSTTLHTGIDRIQFVRTSFDSLIGRYFRPITNDYTYTELTNSVLVTNHVRRVIEQPDFLIVASDLNASGSQRTRPNWSTNAGILNGPGIINPPVTLNYNKVGPMIINTYPNLDQLTGTSNFLWGTFAGGTNDVIVYPFGTHLDDLAPLLLFQITSFDLPDGSVGVPYVAQLEAAGGEPPYSWAPAAASAPLPPGLMLSSGGILSGTPTRKGSYTFSVTVTESGARTTTRTLTITINP